MCDDEAAPCDRTRELVSAYLQAHPALEGKVWAYSDGRTLLAQAEKLGGFDLYLMDILMPDLSGIEVGRQLRVRGDGGEIIYLTNSNDFAADSYDVRAFFYLLKPVEEKKLFQVLDGAVEKLRRRRSRFVVVQTAEGPRRIFLERIRYMERIGRVIRYYCTDGTVDSRSIRVSFRNAVAPLLADRRFFLCGASFVLNFQHISGVNGQIVTMDNGQSLALPRTGAADFKKAWGSYWLDACDTSTDC